MAGKKLTKRQAYLKYEELLNRATRKSRNYSMMQHRQVNLKKKNYTDEITQAYMEMCIAVSILDTLDGERDN